METTNIVLAYVLCLKLNLIASDVCWRINSRQLPYYKLMKSNWRSNQLIVSRTMVQNVNECTKFARVKKALAFNYGLETDRYGKSNDAIANNITSPIREVSQVKNIRYSFYGEKYLPLCKSGNNV